MDVCTDTFVALLEGEIEVTCRGVVSETSEAITVAVWVVSARLVAAMVMVAGDGRTTGGVYKPLAVICPKMLFPLATPLTVHVTLVLVTPLTVAENCRG